MDSTMDGQGRSFVQQMMQPHNGDLYAPLHPAPLLPRVVARMADALLLVVVDLLVFRLVIFNAILGVGSGPVGHTSNIFATALMGLMSAALAVSYFTVMESKFGQTAGKMLFGLKVEGDEPETFPTVMQAAKRNLWVASLFVATLPFVGFLFAPVALLAASVFVAVTIEQDKPAMRGWHDLHAGTVVISARPDSS